MTASSPPVRVATTKVSHEPGLPLGIGRRDDRAAADRRMAVQRSFDLARFDPVAADLHLVVGAAQKLDVAIGEVTREITGAVHPADDGRSSEPERIGADGAEFEPERASTNARRSGPGRRW